MKKLLLTLGTIATIATPVAAIVSCGNTNIDETKKGSLDHGLRILTLGDSVAHGDYTFQMSGSGAGFVPLLDGPARAASYQDFLFDEFKRDGLMDESLQPDYKTSASGLRSGELADWLAKDGTYLKGQKYDLNEALAAQKALPSSASAEKQAEAQADVDAAKAHIEYHRHPYAQGSSKDTWWDDGLKDHSTTPATQVGAKHTTIAEGQQDQSTMAQHVANSDVVLITIGGNDILKDIMVAGTPFPNLGTIDWTKTITGLVGKLVSDPTLQKNANIGKLLTGIIPKIQPLLRALGSLKSSIGSSLTSKTRPAVILNGIMDQISPLIKGVESLPKADKAIFEKWFIETGHQALIKVDNDKVEEDLAKFYKNIARTSEEIKAMNPNAKIIFTGYPSPMMHLPKIFRNLAMPVYGQIASLTKKYADTNPDVYYAASSLKDWETDDPKDLYDNIMIDPHPTLEGQGVMAQDIIKVIDDIYGFNSKITEKELNAEVSDIVESHKKTAPSMTEAEMIKEIKDGSYPYPYQDTKDVTKRGDLDYAYGVKPLPLEELTHAKVYFTSRIATFLIDAITDSIELNENVPNPGDQSVKHPGKLSLSDFTVNWGKSYASYSDHHAGERIIKEISSDFIKTVDEKFQDSLALFIKTFSNKLEDFVASSDKVSEINNLLSSL